MDREPTTEGSRKSKFLASLPPEAASAADPVSTLLLAEYGSMFVARGVAVPPRIVFRDETDVSEFQSGLSIRSAELAGIIIELQARAVEDLLLAVEHAQSEDLTITPRGADAARRRYDQTVELWHSRVHPALKHWVAEGKLSAAEADRIRGLRPFEQVPEVLSLEQEGIFFAKDLSKSIIYSVAPPGTSQHLSMLALDVSEFNDARVRQILAEHHWHQTVVSDLPHFTYLGVSESELPDLGLKKVASGDRSFWVPDI